MSKLGDVIDYLEARKSAFAVSRLIMLTGIPVRRFAKDGQEDPAVLKRVLDTLPSLLTEQELQELMRLLAAPRKDTVK